MVAELLAPAGSVESLKAAIRAGADAVYIGGQLFGARAYADNPDEALMIEAIDYVHMHGRKIYMTINTLFKEEELEKKLYDYLIPYYEAGLDAVIVQDIGTFNFVRTHFPDLHIHASTQMTVTGPNEAAMLQDMGAARVVTAREISLGEIREIRNNTNIEIESFVHGALCYCYSGQCFFSSLIGGRSGNRGRCAQPCRLPYDVISNGKILNNNDEKYILSPKDMCTIELLPQIIESGVFSLKIEGRMKKPEYTACVVSIYRKYLDMYIKNGSKGYHVEKSDIDKLYNIFNRNGFNKSYYMQHNGRDMITLSESKFRAKDESLINSIKSKYLDSEIKEKINGHLIISKENPASLSISDGEIEVSACGQMSSVAMKQPLTTEILDKRTRKTGNTEFEFDKLDIELEDELFMPMGAINELRRDALDMYRTKKISKYHRIKLDKITDDYEELEVKQNIDKCGQTDIHVSVATKEQFESVLAFDDLDCIYIDTSLIFHKGKYTDINVFAISAHKGNKKIYLHLPYIFRTEAINIFNRKIDDIMQSDIDGFVVRNLEEYIYLTDKIKCCSKKMNIIFDHNIYTFNNRTIDVFEKAEQSPELYTIPIELNSKEIMHHNNNKSQIIVYGYLPMMVTAGCINKTMNNCNHNSDVLQLKDRYKAIMNVKCDCNYCYNIIYNNKPLNLVDCNNDVAKAGIHCVRLDFTVENGNQTKLILKDFIQAYRYGKNTKMPDEFTRGHFRRGVE